jgi:hypothetical protein
VHNDKSTITLFYSTSVVGIATGYGLEDRGVAVRVPVKKKKGKAIPVPGHGGP